MPFITAQICKCCDCPKMRWKRVFIIDMHKKKLNTLFGWPIFEMRLMRDLFQMGIKFLISLVEILSWVFFCCCSVVISKNGIKNNTHLNMLISCFVTLLKVPYGCGQHINVDYHAHETMYLVQWLLSLKWEITMRSCCGYFCLLRYYSVHSGTATSRSQTSSLIWCQFGLGQHAT